MGRSASVTRQDVFREADLLTAAGRSVSARTLRESFGSGSLSTIQRHLAAWRAERRALPAASPADLPPHLAALIDDLEARLTSLRSVLAVYVSERQDDRPVAGGTPSDGVDRLSEDRDEKAKLQEAPVSEENASTAEVMSGDPGEMEIHAEVREGQSAENGDDDFQGLDNTMKEPESEKDAEAGAAMTRSEKDQPGPKRKTQSKEETGVENDQDKEIGNQLSLF